MKSAPHVIKALLSLPALLLAGCPTGDTAPIPDVFHLSFTQHADGAAVSLDNETPFTNAAGHAFGVTTLIYFVSDVELVQDADVVPLAGAHHVDVGAGTGLQLVPEDPPEDGRYDSVRFVFGLDAERNVTGAFPERPEALMEWPTTMGGGYHYMQLEGRWMDGDSVRSYALHTGPLGGVDRSIAVELDGPFEVADDQPIELAMNVLAWMESPHVIDLSDPAVSGGVMGNEDVQRLLFENGADVWTAP